MDPCWVLYISEIFNKMSSYAAFPLGSHCFTKYLLIGFQNEKNRKCSTVVVNESEYEYRF